MAYVVVIEDEPGIVDFIERGLTAGGFTVSAARDGETGLELALGERVDLVVLDWTSRASAAMRDPARTVPAPRGRAAPPTDRRRRRRGLLGAGVGAAIAVAGCGGSLARRTESGQAVFSRECSACHSLLGRQSPRQQGGDLRGLRMPRAILLQFAAEMPVPDRLTRAGRTAVVNYILSIQRQDPVKVPG